MKESYYEARSSFGEIGPFDEEQQRRAQHGDDEEEEEKDGS